MILSVISALSMIQTNPPQSDPDRATAFGEVRVGRPKIAAFVRYNPIPGGTELNYRLRIRGEQAQKVNDVVEIDFLLARKQVEEDRDGVNTRQIVPLTINFEAEYRTEGEAKSFRMQWGGKKDFQEYASSSEWKPLPSLSFRAKGYLTNYGYVGVATCRIGAEITPGYTVFIRLKTPIPMDPQIPRIPRGGLFPDPAEIKPLASSTRR